MPNVPIVDTHVHLWDPRELRMSWLDGNDTLEKRYMVDEFTAHTGSVDVDSIVYVEVGSEANYAFIEAQRIQRLAATWPTLAGIVAAAPVEFGTVARTYYQALVDLGPQIKGVRRLFQGEVDVNYAARPEVIAGVRTLAEYGLSFDICIYHPQLPAVIELVRQVPEVQFILDHIAKPAIKAGTLDPWRSQLRELASLPNVVCKISGMTTEADHAHWQHADLVPYADHVIEVFGDERIIFGGDWPVSLMSTTYVAWVETVDRLVSQLSSAAQQRFWCDTAKRVYRLG
ncbi:MAG: amidohydrolase family protein [Roseiflexaceae bacterium]